MSRYDFLPAVLREIAEVAGLDAALTLAEKRGGARLSIPSRVDEATWLARAVGLEAARKIAAHYTSGRTSQELEIPLGPTGLRAGTTRAIRRMLDEGVAGEEIARRLRVASRTVRRHKGRGRAGGGPQGSLF